MKIFDLFPRSNEIGIWRKEAFTEAPHEIAVRAKVWGLRMCLNIGEPGK